MDNEDGEYSGEGESNESSKDDKSNVLPFRRKNAQKEPIINRVYEVLETGLWGYCLFRYDTFGQQQEICLPKGGWALLRDVHYTRIQRYMGKELKFSAPKEMLRDAITDLCEANSYDSLANYLNGLVWDGTPRLEHFLADAFGCEQNERNAFIGAKFIESLVARGLEPGCKMDYCPVFYSEQGMEKSKVLRTLGGKWFTDILPTNLGGRDIVYALQRVWLIEASEMSSFTKAEAEVLKAFISRQVDRVDLKYSNCVEEFKRRCVIVGTTNTQEMLKDSTGGRRFWPVTCGEISVEYVKKNRDQLFAEGAARHKAGVPWWPESQEEHAMLNALQEEHYQADSREADIREFVESRPGDVLMGDVLGHLGYTPDRQIRSVQMEIGQILGRLGYMRKVVRKLGSLARVWVRK